MASKDVSRLFLTKLYSINYKNQPSQNFYQLIAWELVAYLLGSAKQNSGNTDLDDFNPRPPNLYYPPTYA